MANAVLLVLCICLMSMLSVVVVGALAGEGASEERPLASTTCGPVGAACIVTQAWWPPNQTSTPLTNDKIYGVYCGTCCVVAPVAPVIAGSAAIRCDPWLDQAPCPFFGGAGKRGVTLPVGVPGGVGATGAATGGSPPPTVGAAAAIIAGFSTERDRLEATARRAAWVRVQQQCLRDVAPRTQDTAKVDVIARPCGTTRWFAGDPLRFPLVRRSSAGRLRLTLSVDVATFNATLFSFKSRQYCVEPSSGRATTDDGQDTDAVGSSTPPHNGPERGEESVCSSPGPTLEVHPGDILDITLINRIRSSPPAAVARGALRNTMRDPDVVNLHMHGLHVSPNVDNVFIRINPTKARMASYVTAEEEEANSKGNIVARGETDLTSSTPSVAVSDDSAYSDRHRYVYRIPSDHLPGVHWYHSHHHGATALHTLGGLLGTIHVIDFDPAAPAAVGSKARQLPAAYHAMIELRLMLSRVSLCTCNPLGRSFSLLSYPQLLARAMSSHVVPSPTAGISASNDGDDEGSASSTSSPFVSLIDAVDARRLRAGDEFPLDALLCNGQYQPQVTISTHTWHRLELTNGADTFLELELRTEVAGGGVDAAANPKGSDGLYCDVWLLGVDGVLFPRGPRRLPKAAAGDPSHVVLLSSASRASVALSCSMPGRYYLQSLPRLRAAKDFEAAFMQNILTVNVVSPANPDGGPVALGSGVMTMTKAKRSASPRRQAMTFWSEGDIRMPYYLQSTLTVVPDSNVEISMDQRFATPGGAMTLGVGSECQLPGGPLESGIQAPPTTCGFWPFQGVRGSYRVVAPVCSLVNVTFHGAASLGRRGTPHPMHTHVHHFQFVAADDAEAAQLWSQPGDWRDTFPALAGRTNVRLRLDRFTGPVMVHCHFLPHDDLGMMDRWWVTSGAVVVNRNQSTAASCVLTEGVPNCDKQVPAMQAFSSNPREGDDPQVDCAARATVGEATYMVTSPDIDATARDGTTPHPSQGHRGERDPPDPSFTPRAVHPPSREKALSVVGHLAVITGVVSLAALILLRAALRDASQVVPRQATTNGPSLTVDMPPLPRHPSERGLTAEERTSGAAVVVHGYGSTA